MVSAPVSLHLPTIIILSFRLLPNNSNFTPRYKYLLQFYPAANAFLSPISVVVDRSCFAGKHPLCRHSHTFKEPLKRTITSMFRRFLPFKRRSVPEENEVQSPPVSSIDVCLTPSKQEKKRIRPRKASPIQREADRVPSSPGARKTPARKLSTTSHLSKKSENHRVHKSPPSTPKERTNTQLETQTMVTPSPPPLYSPGGTNRKQKAAPQHLPPPKSPPFRMTLRRKASKQPPKKTKSQIIREEVEETYDGNGTLQRTTITKTRNADGTSSMERHKEHLSPASPRYRPKPKLTSLKKSKSKSRSNSAKKTAARV